MDQGDIKFTGYLVKIIANKGLGRRTSSPFTKKVIKKHLMLYRINAK